MTRYAVIARYSSDKQRESSIDDQVRRCREEIERRGGRFDERLVFSDSAVSGASLHRPGFKSMMAAAEAGEFEVLVTEDISRISRDFADSAVLLRKLRFLEIRLIGIADGIDTTQAGAKMSFGFKSLMNEVYLDDLRAKTRRGMEGRFLAGQSAGGTAFGFVTTPVHDGTGKVAGHAIEIDETQAEIVRSIFRLYLEGESLASIARRLSDDGRPTPRSGKRRRKGWVASTVRNILHNERYIGTWVHNKRRWVKDPETGRRRPRLRPRREWIVQERPELRIVDQDLWDAVAARLEEVRARYTKTKTGRPKGKSRPGGSTHYPFSGLLECGVCGAPMTIYGGSTKRRYRCSDNVKRGTCENALSVREDVAREVLLAEIEKTLKNPWSILYARKLLAEQAGRQSREATSELTAREAELERTEKRIAGLVNFLADGDRSEYVIASLHELEEQARDHKRVIAQLRSRSTHPIELPTPEEAAELIGDLRGLAEREPTHAREVLRSYLRGGTIVMRALPGERAYEATADLLPLRVLIAETPPGKPKRRRYLAVDCGGRI